VHMSGSACPRTCDTPDPDMCTMQCVARCDCPPEAPILSAEGECVPECSSKTSGAVDEEGVISFCGDGILRALGPNPKSSPKNISVRVVLDNPSDELSTIPYSLSFKYAVDVPKRNPKLKSPPVLRLKVYPDLAGSKNPVEGDVVTIRAVLRNIAKEKDGSDKGAPVPLAVAVVGIPGGFEPRTDQLRELKQSGAVDFVESRPGQVILYWRALAPNAVKDVPIQVTAVVPGVYDSPASRAYLFYNDEDKVWSEGFQVKIEPQPQGGKAKLVW